MDLADHRATRPGSRTPTLEALEREALAACHADLLAARQTVLTLREPAGIHATRVALRRMRAAAALFGRALADETILALRADAKTLADACGATRDLDVFLAGVLAEAESTLAALAETTTGLRAFRATALRLRRNRHNAARRALTGEVFTVFDARVTGLLATPMRYPATMPPRSDARGLAMPGDPAARAMPDAMHFARDVLGRRDRKLRKGLNRLDRLDGAGRHALRLRVKKQRYAASFLARLFDRKAAAAYIDGAAGLQDALGLANDRVVAAKVIADVRAAARPKGRLDWVAGLVAGWLVVRAQGIDEDERTLAAASRRLTRAPRFWRRRGRGQHGEGR